MLKYMTYSLKNVFIIYLINQFFSKIFNFFKGWYFDGFLFFWKKLRNILGAMDYTFAVRITIRNWMKPLYQDRTILGYILGPIFRTARILIGSFIYLIVFLIWLSILAIWFSIPIYLIYGSIFGI